MSSVLSIRGIRPSRWRDDAEVDRDGRVAADARHRLLLQDAQEVDLDLGAHVADLVEEQRALVGELDLAAAARDRAGEGAPLVAEQLALEDPFGRAPQFSTTNGPKRRVLRRG